VDGHTRNRPQVVSYKHFAASASRIDEAETCGMTALDGIHRAAPFLTLRAHWSAMEQATSKKESCFTAPRVSAERSRE
jgi:hypothetical protein